MDKINRTSWKAKDLEKICAFLNSNDGGEIIYNVKARDTVDSIQRITNLISKKIKKIGPDTDGLIQLLSGETDGQRYLNVHIMPSRSICYVKSRSGDKSYYYLLGGRVIKTSEGAIKKYKQDPLAIIENDTNKKEDKVARSKQIVTKKSITKLTSMIPIPDTSYVDNYTFSSGNTVPIIEALSVYGFNRIVGYLKYINRTFANVYSRGECKLHDSLIPSLYRKKTNLQNENKKISLIVNRFFSDNKLLDSLSLDTADRIRSQYRIEGVLQHYGATTSFLDVVDNHWVALWMGLNRYKVVTQINKYAQYIEREIPLTEKISGDLNLQDQEKWEENIYQYVLLIAVPFSNSPYVDGISITKEFVEIDLRKALPSYFLRPHAQHGLVIKKNVEKNIPQAEDYDISTNVVAIIKIRIDRAKKWIGNGELLTQSNLVPPPGFDPGYDLLLSKYDIFHKSSLKITKYL